MLKNDNPFAYLYPIPDNTKIQIWVIGTQIKIAINYTGIQYRIVCVKPKSKFNILDLKLHYLV